MHICSKRVNIIFQILITTRMMLYIFYIELCGKIMDLSLVRLNVLAAVALSFVRIILFSLYLLRIIPRHVMIQRVRAYVPRYMHHMKGAPCVYMHVMYIYIYCITLTSTVPREFYIFKKLRNNILTN